MSHTYVKIFVNRGPNVVKARQIHVKNYITKCYLLQIFVTIKILGRREKAKHLTYFDGREKKNTNSNTLFYEVSSDQIFLFGVFCASSLRWCKHFTFSFNKSAYFQNIFAKKIVRLSRSLWYFYVILISRGKIRSINPAVLEHVENFVYRYNNWKICLFVCLSCLQKMSNSVAWLLGNCTIWRECESFE